MALFLFRFYPVLFPLLVYYLWWQVIRHRARRQAQPLPRFRDGPVYWLVLSSLLVAMGCLLMVGMSQDTRKGTYRPPHMEGNRLIPAQVAP